MAQSNSIQVFLRTDPSHAEISCDLLRFEIKNDCLFLSLQDEDFKFKEVIPLSNIAQVRIYNE